ncbi:MAG: peptide-methionine (S)-S-oxide reductase MsrA [Flavobacteriales bacterium]|nr:peptide-methionine (S)-S-oxide reductase MsrA [Flavobacteriales bacterium]
METQTTKKQEVITLGSGCFWCTEAIFERIKGVEAVKSGFSGGQIINPSYREVCNGTTGHAEVVQVVFNPSIVSVQEILEVFWSVHDPTTLNRQGNDIGTHYRSAVFYHNENQKAIAEEYMEQLNNSAKYPNPIVTEITAWTNFFPADGYHDDYYDLNGTEPYCQFVIHPKVEKFEREFKAKLKE